MSRPAPPTCPSVDFSKLKLRSRTTRSHKVTTQSLAATPPAGCSFATWLESLPGFLGALALRSAVQAIVAARRAGRPVLLAFGGHVIKTGCGPLLIDLMDRGLITAIATNGSGAIHDLELAETGETSEEVADTLRDGAFGMVSETIERMDHAARLGADGRGLGRALGELLLERSAPLVQHSVFAAAARLGLPATVHVAIGTDTVHVSPAADGAALGAATLADFRRFCECICACAGSPGGVYLNVGSAVVMPEVFLKAVSVARNLGFDLDEMHTVNLDMLRHYRPQHNVLTRPVARGNGHALTGQHEILLPLLRQAVLEAWEAGGAPARPSA